MRYWEFLKNTKNKMLTPSKEDIKKIGDGNVVRINNFLVLIMLVRM
jgi:hypothetical protein